MQSSAQALRLVDSDDAERAIASRLPTFDELFSDYSGYVATIGMRILGREDDIDDLVQDVFLDVYRGLSRVKEPGAIKWWLATITVRKSRRRLRTRKVGRLFSREPEQDYLQVAAAEAPPEERMLLAHVYRALDRVPAKKRVAWCLRRIEGESLESVAQMCECSLATVKRWITDAHTIIAREVEGG